MTLDELRQALAEVDRDILRLVARRHELVAEVGAAKRRVGTLPRDYRQEKEVIERARRLATQLRFSPDLAERLMLALIDSSLALQEQEQVAARGGGDGRRALVIGGAGRMGSWFVKFLGSQGFAVEVADPAGGVPGHDHVSDWQRADLRHDVIVVAAPLGASNEILHGLAAAKAPGLVFDIGSLKSPLRSGLLALRDAGASVTSVHPMFGPDTELLSGRHVIFVEVGAPEATRQARELFAPTMAVQVCMDLEGHDRLIAYVLGLSHAVNIAFFTALAESGESAPQLARLSSTTFDEQLGVASKVAHDSPTLYFEIQSLNDYGTEALTSLLYAVERLRSVVRAGDEAGFVALMERGRRYLEGRRADASPTPPR